MPPLRGSFFCPIRGPSAYALGYIDVAAPRLDFFTASEDDKHCDPSRIIPDAAHGTR